MTEFQNIAQAVAFTSHEIALFHALSHSWNVARRPTVIEQWAEVTSRLAGLTKDTLPQARNKLIQAGVIFFEKIGNRSVPRYSLNALFQEDSPFEDDCLLRERRSKSPSKRRVSDRVSGVSYQVEEKGKESPPNPQGGMEDQNPELIPTEKTTADMLPSNARRMRALDQKRTKAKGNTATMSRINEWFGRRPDTIWTVAELLALIAINPTDPEITGMENFYLADDPDDCLFRRRDLLTMLNNWQGELDKARGYARKQRGAA